jgi:tyrosinase
MQTLVSICTPIERSTFANRSSAALVPFRSDASGGFWTSETVRDTRAFGYEYPETDEGATAAEVKTAINQLYGPILAKTPAKRGLLKGAPTPEETRDWYVDIVTSTLPERGSYYVYALFQNSGGKTNLVGAHCAISMSPGCGNSCPVSNHGDLRTTASLPLNDALLKEVSVGNIDSLKPDDVLPHLHKDLKIKCVQVSLKLSRWALSPTLPSPR